jgi:hypothetical protein
MVLDGLSNRVARPAAYHFIVAARPGCGTERSTLVAYPQSSPLAGELSLFKFLSDIERIITMIKSVSISEPDYEVDINLVIISNDWAGMTAAISTARLPHTEVLLALRNDILPACIAIAEIAQPVRVHFNVHVYPDNPKSGYVEVRLLSRP